MVSYYNGILKDERINHEKGTNSILQHIPHSATHEQNERIMHPMSLEEVTTTIKYMPNKKALGLERFTAELFNNYWDIIQYDV